MVADIVGGSDNDSAGWVIIEFPKNNTNILTKAHLFTININQREVCMIFRIFSIIFFIAALQAPLFGQAKVGIAGVGTSFFLELSPAVRANGMGQAGVALVDNYASYFNPGAVGLLHDNDRFNFTFYPQKADFGTGGFFQLGYWAGSLRLWSGKLGTDWLFRLNLAYAHTRLRSYLFSATYPHPMGEWIKIIDRTHSVSLSMSVSAIPEISVGATWKNIYERFMDESASGRGFDFGIMVRLPFKHLGFIFDENRRDRWCLSPSVGISWCNVGPHIRIRKYEYPLPYFYRAGLALPFGFEKKVSTDHIMIFRLTPAIELMRYPGEEKQDKFGLELTLVDAISGRVGRREVDLGYYLSRYDSWGFGVDSQGLIRFFTALLSSNPTPSYGWFTKLLRDDLKIEFSYSNQKLRDGTNYLRSFNDNYYGITISY
jgi:hypothetical protein